MTDDGWIDDPLADESFDSVQRALLRVSRRITRRGFFTRTGVLLAGAAAGTTAWSALAPQSVLSPAGAIPTDFCSDCGNVGMCGKMCNQCGGASDNRSCPPGTTASGCWSACACCAKEPCAIVRYCDCCGTPCGVAFCENGCPQQYWGCGSASNYRCTRSVVTSTAC